MLLEICVDSVESSLAAERGGAQRVELCSDLLEGGITPSAGLLEVVRKLLRIDVFVMIRPRGGDFFYTPHEFQLMKTDIQYARSLGADGVVLGILDQDGYVDVARTRELVELARPLPVTFHRAIDVSADRTDSLERIIATGAHRVLTSGGKRRAMESIEGISASIAGGRGRIGVVAGGGINSENIREIALHTGAAEYHAGLNTRISSPVIYQNDSLYLGTDMDREYSRYLVREEDVRSLRQQLDLIEVEQSTGRGQPQGSPDISVQE